VTLDFISPNLEEAEALIQNVPDNIYLINEENVEERALAAAGKLYGKLAKNVLITAGKFGVAFKNSTEHFWVPAFTLPEDKFKSSVGAGDSFVAGFAMYLEEHPGDFQNAIKFGMACGAAQCETYEPGNLIKERALEIFETGRA
jgi:fructose-1-phosphate kinase PfkB-like protein